MCLSNIKAIRQFKVPISWLRDFTRSYEKTSFRILRRGPGGVIAGILGNYLLPCLLLYHVRLNPVATRLFAQHVVQDSIERNIKTPHYWPIVSRKRFLVMTSSWSTKLWATYEDTITVTSPWARWRLKSPAYRLFTQLFVQVVTSEFVAQRASNAETVSIQWRHHASDYFDHNLFNSMKPGDAYMHMAMNWVIIDSGNGWSPVQRSASSPFNSSPRWQNGRHFADDVFGCIFLKYLYFDSNLTFLNNTALVGINTIKHCNHSDILSMKLVPFTNIHTV